MRVAFDALEKDVGPRRLVTWEPSFHAGPWLRSFIVLPTLAPGQFSALKLTERKERQPWCSRGWGHLIEFASALIP